jgi:hypothetical protein
MNDLFHTVYNVPHWKKFIAQKSGLKSTLVHKNVDHSPYLYIFWRLLSICSFCKYFFLYVIMSTRSIAIRTLWTYALHLLLYLYSTYIFMFQILLPVYVSINILGPNFSHSVPFIIWQQIASGQGINQAWNILSCNPSDPPATTAMVFSMHIRVQNVHALYCLQFKLPKGRQNLKRSEARNLSVGGCWRP